MWGLLLFKFVRKIVYYLWRVRFPEHYLSIIFVSSFLSEREGAGRGEREGGRGRERGREREILYLSDKNIK